MEPEREEVVEEAIQKCNLEEARKRGTKGIRNGCNGTLEIEAGSVCKGGAQIRREKMS